VSDEPLARPVSGHSGLSDAERDFLAYLTVMTVATQLDIPPADVAEALKELADRGEVRTVGDARDVHVIVSGRPIVHAARDWLRVRAHAGPDELN
jgi:hypothetical protein